MCCCNKPNVNGTPGAYSWDGKGYMTRPPAPPALGDGDELIYDLPGRCGGLPGRKSGTDSHSYHLRVVKQRYGGYALLVRHGGGDERHSLGYGGAELLHPLETLDDNARYWFLSRFYHVHKDAIRAAEERTRHEWATAFLDKRIKTKRRNNMKRVFIVKKNSPTAIDSGAEPA